ncbi:MAG TPA: cupredoxin domain-containing protein [Acidimicrobiia bacterium]|nr:cupredoxin domain-containing protein [Acidimicrobiia bacterium]
MKTVRSHRRQLLLPAVVALLSLTLVGVPAKGAACSPEGTTLTLTAFDNKFDKDCLAAPADQNFTIEFSNLDRNIPHNVAIYEDASARKSFFRGDLTDGPGKQTYSVPGLPAGTWFFRCDPHTEMNGTFVAG